MNRIFKTTFFLLFIASTSFAQTTILNGGFENWENVGSSTAVPQYWNSNKNGSSDAQLAAQTCFQSTTAHSGSYSAQVESGSTFGTVVNGALTTGYVDAPDLTKADGFIESDYNSGTVMQFVGRPDSLVFWYQYTPSGSDSASVQARLHVGHCYNPEAPSNSNHPDSTVNIISRALWTSGTGTVSTWTRVSVPFVYVDGRTPQYILVSATSSASHTGGTANSTLLIDDIAVIYNPTIATSTVTTGPYYVSATTGASVSVPFTLTGVFNNGNTITAQLSNASGSFASPVNIGVATTGVSGTINATIPANTPSGAGYRIRVVSSNPVLTAADNGSNISVILTGTSIAPSTTQNIAANTNGAVLTVTETPAATSRQWESGSASGGPYTAISGQTGTTYTPNFNTVGTYYVVCISTYPGGLSDTSNQVLINVVQNSIAPTSSQSILTGVNGTQLTVTETPVGTSRQWESGTTSGGPYTPITDSTNLTYTPNFSSAGTYYVVCVSTIDGVTATSNEVEISVGSATLTTGTINGSPFLFSPHAPNASVNVPYTTSGTFNGGNIFTAQLSDAAGSFTIPTNIGTVAATTSGSISATILNTTPSGTGYRIRVISGNPVVYGSDNGVDLVVNQFTNSIAPTTTQTIALSTNGTPIAVTNSQTATQNWEYSTTSGSGYASFTAAQTGTNYTPNFTAPGTYYIVCVSTNQYNDSVISNQVQINVLNGDTLITLAVTGSPYYVSAHAHDTVNVNFTSTAVFTNGNVFTAQLSDNTGNFATPVNIGTLNSNTIGAITAMIPDNSVAGTAYRIRVISSNPAITGSDNGANLTIVPFTINVAPIDTQRFPVTSQGSLITATSSQVIASYLWQYSQTGLSIDFAAFSPTQTADTLLPAFADTGLYYINCTLINQVNDTAVSQNIIAIVESVTGIARVPAGMLKIYWSNNDFVADLSHSTMQSPVLELTDIAGQQVAVARLNSATVNRIATQLPAGIYVFRIYDSKNSYTGKAGKP